jgi:hypothetical protein
MCDVMASADYSDLDAVKRMREIRDGLSRKLMNMTHEEQRRYVEEQLELQGISEREEARQDPTS